MTTMIINFTVYCHRRISLKCT